MILILSSQMSPLCPPARLVGKGKTKELILSGNPMNAHEAKSIGLIGYRDRTSFFFLYWVDNCF
jgi:hypothetical protein